MGKRNHLLQMCLAVFVGILMVGVLKIKAQASWDGTYDTAWYDNVSASTYHISTAEELAGLAYIVNTRQTEFVDKTIYLDNDIDLSGGHDWIPIDWGGWTDQKRECPSFRGIFDGQGHTISNMKIKTVKAAQSAGVAPVGKDEYYSEVGLFGRMDGELRNLKMENAQIELPDDEAKKVIAAGFFAGTICHDERKSTEIVNPGINNCEVNNSKIHGIGIAYASSFCGKHYDDADLRNCPFTNTCIIEIGTINDLSKIYDRELYASYKDTNTFIINTDAELAAIVMLSEAGNDFAGKEVYLGSDLDMSPYEWRPIKSFSGVFNGQGHNIGGLHAKESGQNMAFIAKTKGCQILNLCLEVDFPTAVSSGSITAGFIAYIRDSGEVLLDNCSIYGEIGRESNISSLYTGNGTIAGGFVGEAWICSSLKINNCRDYATVTGFRSGGIIGQILRSSVSITNDMIYADVGTANNGCAGGIVGRSVFSNLLIEGSGVNGTKNSGTKPLRISGGSYVGGMIGSIDNCGFPVNYKMSICNSFCNALISLNNSKGIAAGFYNIGQTNMHGQDTYSVSGSYFGGTLTYVPEDENGQEHMFGCYGFNTADSDKSKCNFMFDDVFILYQLFVNKKVTRKNDYLLAPEGYSTGSNDELVYFNAAYQDDKDTTFGMHKAATSKFGLLDRLNQSGENTGKTSSVEWTSNSSYDYGLPILSNPVPMQNESYRLFGTANIIISGETNSNMPFNSYKSFTDSYAKADGTHVPWQTVNVNSGMTFRVDVTNALSDSSRSEKIMYSSQLFQKDDVIEMYVVNQDRSGFAAGPYTYTITGSEGYYRLPILNIRLLPIQNFKDGKGNTLDSIRYGFQSLVFNVKFGANSRGLKEDIKVCRLYYNSIYRTTEKSVYLKNNNISLQIKNSTGGKVVIDSEYQSPDDVNTYVGNSDKGIPINVVPSEGYQIKTVTMKDNEKGTMEKIPVSSVGDATYFVWRNGETWTVIPEFEKKVFSVLMKGEHVTLRDPDGNPVEVTTEKVVYGDSYSFTLQPIGDWFISGVEVNGQIVTPNQDDIYTVDNIKDAVRINVTTLPKMEQTDPEITEVPQTVTYGDADFALTAADGQGTGEYQWSSDDEDILQIDSQGKVTVKKAGTTKIKLLKEGDYQYLDSEEVSVQITVQPKKITVTGLKASDKTYDGNDKAQIIAEDAVITGLLTGDDLDIEFNEGKFASKDAGDSIAIIPGKCTLTGDDASNYELGAAPVIPKAKIEKAPLKVSVNDIIINKGQTATLKVSVKGFVNGETESTDSTYSRPVAKASFDSMNTALTTVKVAYSGGNAGRNYKFESYSKTARITINKVSASASDVLFDADRNEWHKSINLTPGKGYHKISGDGSTFSDDLTVTTEGENQITVYLKKADGTVTEGVKVTCRIDTTSPTDLKVKYGDGEFHAMANSTGFNHFVKGASAVTATASDALSGIASLAYYASATAVTDFTNVSWQNSLTLPDSSKQIVYVKATDKAGNASIACEGVVVYQNSVISPNSFVFDLNAPQNIATTVSLLGNGLKEIKNGQSTLTAGTDYVLDGEKLTVLSGYLVSALGAGNIDLTLYFTPMGEETGQVTVSALLTISNHKHSTIKTEAVAATHFKTGNIEYYTCSICKRIYSDALCTNEITEQDTITQVIPHNVEGKAWEHDATNHWKTCECGEKIGVTVHDVTGKAWEHDATNHWKTCECGEKIDLATHDVTGKAWEHDATNHWKTCECGEKIGISAHDVEGKTWEHDATNHWKTCECGEKIGMSAHDVEGKAWEHDATNHWKTCGCGEKIDTSTHSFVWVIDRAATVEQAGLKHEACEVCGSVRSENTEIPKLDPVHVHSVEGKNWDCNDTNHWKTCDCGEQFSIEAHNFVWVTDRNATKTEAGTKHEECMICGYKRNEGTEIPKLPSDPEPEEVPAAPEEVNPLKWYYEPEHPGTLCKMMPQGEACMEAFRKVIPEGYEEAFTFNFSFVEDSYEPRYNSKKGYFQLAYPEEYRKEGRSFALIGINQLGETKLFYDTDKYDETITVMLDVDGYAFQLISSDTVEQQNIYVVKKGDTLTRIAAKLKTTVWYLKKENLLEDPNKLYIGQKIKY